MGGYLEEGGEDSVPIGVPHGVDPDFPGNHPRPDRLWGPLPPLVVDVLEGTGPGVPCRVFLVHRPVLLQNHLVNEPLVVLGQLLVVSLDKTKLLKILLKNKNKGLIIKFQIGTYFTSLLGPLVFGVGVPFFYA